MKVRLIGIGDVGEAIALSCVNEFDRLGIGSMLESHRVIQLTSPAFQHTLDKVMEAVQDYLTLPRQEMWLRSGLGYLFFGGPASDFDARLELLLGERPRPDDLAGNPGLTFWLDTLLPLVRNNAEINKQVQKALDKGCELHDEYLAHNARLGNDWLLLPAMPLDRANLKPRRANIGRKLMKSVLKAGGQKKLIDNLGKNPPDPNNLSDAKQPSDVPDVDIVAILFSAGDSFGVEGAELLAEEIRSALKHPEATRVIATLGFAVYERNNNEAQDGRCAGRYMGLTRLRGQLDGLVIRARPDADEQAFARGLGFPQLLASLAMASDPSVIQIDNPDANQLQRDFGRRLFAAGFTDAASVPKIEPNGGGGTPMNLMEMYRQAKQNLVDWHCAEQGLEGVWQTLSEQVKGLSARAANWAQNKPKWLDVLRPTANGGQPARPVEFETARKVIAYIGHNGQLNAQELQELRRSVYKDFPRARTVIYKYGISFSPKGIPSASHAPAIETRPVAQQANPPAAKAVTPPAPAAPQHPQAAQPSSTQRRASIFERIFGRTEAEALPPAAKQPVPPLPVPPLPVKEKPAAPPAGANLEKQAAVQATPQPAAARATAPAKAAPIAHFALFVVDTFQTLAFERLSNFVRNNVDVRPGNKAPKWNPQLQINLIIGLVNALMARSLLSQPFDPSQPDSHKKPWSPPGLDQAALRTCVRDSVLGGLDDDFQPFMTDAVCAYVVGERLLSEPMRTEAEATADTVEEGATFLIEEAPEFRFTGEDLADVLCGLNVICNEHLEPRKVQRELTGCLDEIAAGAPDGGGSAGDGVNLT